MRIRRRPGGGRSSAAGSGVIIEIGGRLIAADSPQRRRSRRDRGPARRVPECPRMPRTVITFGTFDVFHVGHLRVIERAAALGDRLVVGVSADALNLRKKGREPVFSQARAAGDRRRAQAGRRGLRRGEPRAQARLHRPVRRRRAGHGRRLGRAASTSSRDVCEVVYLPAHPGHLDDGADREDRRHLLIRGPGRRGHGEGTRGSRARVGTGTALTLGRHRSRPPAASTPEGPSCAASSPAASCLAPSSCPCCWAPCCWVWWRGSSSPRRTGGGVPVGGDRWRWPRPRARVTRSPTGPWSRPAPRSVAAPGTPASP